MSMTKTFSALAVALAMVANPVASMGSYRGGAAETDSSSVGSSVLSPAEVEDLVYMREEEKLARDVYLTMFDTWGAVVFESIATSEQQHTDSVEDMIEKYRLSDPVVDDRIGVFVNPVLAQLYADLVARGATSSLEALYVGALIEEVDMVDLKHAIEEADNDDIRLLYENLMTGSRNHLRSFAGQIEDMGIVYEAQYLSQEEVDEIIDSPMERGKRR